MKASGHVPAFVIMLLCCASAAAQVSSAGFFHSYKGLGVSLQSGSPGSRDFNDYTLYADMAGVFSGNADAPGIKFCYSHNVRVHTFESNPGTDFCIFAGSGVTAGWVNDFQRPSYGFEGALAGTFGTRAAFARNILLTAGLTLEAGAFIHYDGRGVRLSVYRNGLNQAVYPHISISYLIR